MIFAPEEETYIFRARRRYVLYFIYIYVYMTTKAAAFLL